MARYLEAEELVKVGITIGSALSPGAAPPPPGAAPRPVAWWVSLVVVCRAFAGCA